MKPRRPICMRPMRVSFADPATWPPGAVLVADGQGRGELHCAEQVWAFDTSIFEYVYQRILADRQFWTFPYPPPNSFEWKSFKEQA